MDGRVEQQQALFYTVLCNLKRNCIPQCKTWNLAKKIIWLDSQIFCRNIFEMACNKTKTNKHTLFAFRLGSLFLSATKEAWRKAETYNLAIQQQNLVILAERSYKYDWYHISKKRGSTSFSMIYDPWHLQSWKDRQTRNQVQSSHPLFYLICWWIFIRPRFVPEISSSFISVIFHNVYFWIR